MLDPSNGQLASDPLVPIEQASPQIGPTPRRLRYAVRSGEVRGVKVLGRYYLFQSEIERLRNLKPPPPASARP